ncbi:myelin-oligodendrocyte glycoprotein-like isoform X2 [Gymnodraco acuticeps]|uniref:Myelin-oligodendrocyte glycoprotein-like isoform X2 n=1 Tax=Gymnodraco acuticeps TaxID=8218 RepID=A0A6P8THS4_GYMAC|nr:myelin-oligodendrocyte glycoprotein-like isoform X2 [Gymnodraco acuticeps]
MIFLILLLLFLTPCVSGIFVVNVTQTSYQAEENQNITLEWTFSTRRETSLRSISTFCQLFTEGRYSVLFHLHQGVESPESQDPQFAGRVQWDKDVLTEGRLTLHVSRLRTSDSGLYVCKVFTDYGRNNGRCWLNVTAAEELEPQRPSESPQAESPRRLWLIVVITTLILFVVSMACIVLIRFKRRTYNAAIQMESSSEEQTIRTNMSPSESEHEVRLSNI